MRTTLLIIFSLLISTTAMAQRVKFTQNSQDTTLVIKKRNSTITYEGREAQRKWKNYNHWHWDEGQYMGFNLTYSGLVQNLRNMQLPNDAAGMQLTTKSIGIDINFIDFVIYSYRRFGIVSGMGIESNNFRFQNNISLAKDANGNTIIDNSFTERGINLTKSKLTTTYLNVPLLFQLRFGTKGKYYDGGFISAGAIVGLRLQSYTKTVSHELGKQKHFDDFNLRNFHLGFQATVGYRGFSLTAKYYPQSIFRPGAGPQMQHVSVGIGYMF